MNNYAFRVNRGGGWFHGGATYLAARARYRFAPSDRHYNLGFRCVQAKFSGSSRAFRGGGWTGDAASCRAANRNGFIPGIRVSNIGFRLVRRDG